MLVALSFLYFQDFVFFFFLSLANFEPEGIYCFFYQKRDSSLGPLTSTSDKSSGIKSTSTPSTPRAESINFRTESRLSQSLLTETSPSADLLSDARHDRGVPEDSFLGQETPSVSLTLFSCAT